MLVYALGHVNHRIKTIPLSFYHLILLGITLHVIIFQNNPSGIRIAYANRRIGSFFHIALEYHVLNNPVMCSIIL